MKKILSRLFLMVTFLGFTVALVGCGAKPELDFDEAKKNLEAKDYFVAVNDKEELLEVNVVKTLHAHSLENNDYRLYMTEYADKKSAKLAYEEIKAEYETAIEALKREIKEYENILKKYEDKLDSDEIDHYEDEIKDLEKELEELKEDSAYGRSGKVVWYGSVEAVEATK